MARIRAAAVGLSSESLVPVGTAWVPGAFQAPSTVAVPSSSKRTMFEVAAFSSRATSSVATAKTRCGSCSPATTTATRRSAACSAARSRSSCSSRRRCVMSRMWPVNSGGPLSWGRVIPISAGNSLPSARMAGSSSGWSTIRPRPVRT